MTTDSLTELRTSPYDGSTWLWPKSDHGCWNGMHHDLENVPTYLKYIPEDERISVVQAGGNCGWMPNWLAKHFHLVYTFEPDPLNFYCLSANCKTANVFKYQAALGENHDTKIMMRTVPENIGMHYVEETEIGAIPTLTIDDLNLSVCNFIQLDTEAYELPILKGAVKTLDKFRPVLSLEIADARSIQRYNYTMGDLVNWLKQFDYELVEKVNMDYIFVSKPK